jgi:hypothetical protein
MPTATGDSAVPKAEAVTETLTETVTESSAAGATEVAVPKVSNLETIDEGNGRRQFRWEAEGLLPPGATYEVAVWKKEGAVRGIVNIRETYVSVSLDNLYTSGQIETGLLHWGVRLVDTASGSEAQLLAQGDDFEYQPQSKSDNDGTKGDSTRG